MRAKLPILTALVAALLVAAGARLYQNQNVQDYARGITQPPIEVLATTDSRTNIALLGVGGQGHQGGELTDSILIASVHHDTKMITLISIPRDIYLTSYRAKINSIYYYGDQAEPGTGLSKLKTALTEVAGLPIHYSLLIDFSGFIKAIDAVGGITVTVDQTFDDYKYPIPGKENVEPESGVDLIKTFTLLGNTIGLVYLSDKTEEKRGLFPGGGDMPLESLLIRMGEAGYDGYFTLDIDPESLSIGNEKIVIERIMEAESYLGRYFHRG